MKRLFCTILAVLFLTGMVRADEKVTFFSASGPQNQVGKSHTWAVFEKTTADKTQTCTISWMPKSGKIIPLKLKPEFGENLTHDGSLKWAKNVGAKVVQHGPYRVRDGLFDLAVIQNNRLTSNRVMYKCVDNTTRPRAINCIHAVSDILMLQNPLKTGFKRGFGATEDVVEHFRPWYFND